jgi:hypothetical protein
MTTNVALFLACAPIGLLVAMTAAVFAFVLLLLPPARLPALGAFVHARREWQFIRMRPLQ